MSSEPPEVPPPPPAPPPPTPAPAMPPGYIYAPSPPTDGMAIAALVLGITAALGTFCYGIPAVILGPIAVFLGLRARKRISASGGAVGGAGLAIAGWITGLAAASVGALFLIVVIGLIAMAAFSRTP